MLIHSFPLDSLFSIHYDSGPTPVPINVSFCRSPSPVLSLPLLSLPLLSLPLVAFPPSTTARTYGLAQQHPGLRQNQMRDILYKQFQKAPENPFNQVSVAYNAKKEERLETLKATMAAREEKYRVDRE